MTKTLSKIVFFGSGPVAAKSLELLKESFDIECVITKPSTEKLMQAVVPKTTVFCVSNKSELDNLISKTDIQSDIALLIDFGIIVSQQVIDSFDKGVVNSHFSLLPEWRGADPITFSILSGQEVTGVSLMLLVAGMDEGPVLAQGELKLNGTETSDELTDDLITLSDALLTEIIPKYLENNISVTTQEEMAQQLNRPTGPTYSRKLTKADGLIDWTKPAQEIEREIRAYISWPRSYTKLGNTELIIKKASVLPKSAIAGQYEYDKNTLIVFCGKDALSLEIIQPAGKKEMPVKAFLAGYKL